MSEHCKTDIGCDNPDCETCNPVCEICGGTGEVEIPVWDEDSHSYHPTGTKRCVCRLKDNEE